MEARVVVAREAVTAAATAAAATAAAATVAAVATVAVAAATVAATEAEAKAEVATAAVMATAARKAGAMTARLPYSASLPRYLPRYVAASLSAGWSTCRQPQRGPARRPLCRLVRHDMPHHAASRQKCRCTSAASVSRRRQTLPPQGHGLVGLPRQQSRLTGASTVHRRSSGPHARSGLPATSLRRAHICRRGLQLDLGWRALLHVGLLSPYEERKEPSSWRVEGSGMSRSQPWGSGSGG